MTPLPEPIAGEDLVQCLTSGQAVVVTRACGEEGIDRHLLSAEDYQRATSFTHEPSLAAFLTGRTLLRTVLSLFVDEVTLPCGPHGKPNCPHPMAPAFNLSHAGGRVFAVFSPCGPVGIDAETIDRVPKNLHTLARKVFTPDECAQLNSGASDFLRLWTQKEAVLKATGRGFSAGAATLSAQAFATASGWEVRHFHSGDLLGAVCLPSRVSYLLRGDVV